MNFEINDPSFWVTKMDSHADPEKHKTERIQNGFSVYDWWNFCDYLAWVNIHGLEKFKSGVGYPANLGGMDEWIVILDKMIEGFKAHLAISECLTSEEVNGLTMGQLNNIRDEGLRLYAEYFPSLWD